MEAILIAEMPVLYRIARRYTLDSALAEDLVGQTLLKAVAGWSNFDGASPRAWLVTILHRCFLAHIRYQSSRGTTVELTECDHNIDTSLFNEVLNKLTARDMIMFIDELPEDFRLVVVLCDVEEMSYEEAAQVLQIPVGTIRSRLYRGRRKVQARLAEQGLP